MSIAEDFKNYMNGGELPEDNLQYAEIDPVILNNLASKCYVVAVVEHKKYLEMVLRNLEDQSVYFCLHIYNPALVEVTSWKAGDDGAKYVIDSSKM